MATHVFNKPLDNDVSNKPNYATEMEMSTSDSTKVSEAMTSTNQAIANKAGKDTLAIIANGDTHPAIPSGWFVYVKNNTHNLPDGLYYNKAAGTIGANNSISTSNVEIVSNGGLNKIKSDIANIGTIVTGTNTGNVNTTSGTKTEVGSITLTSGTWVICGSIDWAANGNGYRQATFDTAVNDNPARGFTSCIAPVSTASKQTYQQIVRILKVTEQTALKFYGQQNSGSTLAAYPYIYAIRII